MRVIKAGRPTKPKKKPGIKVKKGTTNSKLRFIITMLVVNFILCSAILLKLYGVLDIWLQKIL